MCIFSLSQLQSISSLKQISWCFNQNHDVNNENAFIKQLSNIAQNLNLEFVKQQEEKEEKQDFNEILDIQKENIKILGFAQYDEKWKKESKQGYFDDWRQYILQESFAEEAYQFGLKIIKAYSNKFFQQETKESMKDLNSFITNLCKQWDSIQRLPDLLEFSELVQHQQNQKMKQKFEEIISNNKNIEKTEEMVEDIKQTFSKQNKDIKLSIFDEIQEIKDKEAENLFCSIQKQMNQQLEIFKNAEKISKKIFKKYLNMIQNRIKSSLQECQLAMRNEIQNQKIEFQKMKGFINLDKYVEDLRYKLNELKRLKNDENAIKKQFDEIWDKIMQFQQKAVDKIFFEFSMKLFQIITNEFSNYYLKSENEETFQNFFLRNLLKEPPSEKDFEYIFDQFCTELKANQFVPIEKNLKNRILIEIFYRDFDLKIQSQDSSDYFQLSQFYQANTSVYYVDQNEIQDYLKSNIIHDLKQYIQKMKQDSVKKNQNQSLNKLVNEFFSALFCFGVKYDQEELLQFINTLETSSSFINTQKLDEKKEQSIKVRLEKIFKLIKSPDLNHESEKYLSRIQELYRSLKINMKEFELSLEQSQGNIFQFATKQIGKNIIIIHSTQTFKCSIQDEKSQQTFQYIQNQQTFSHYQNTFKTHISDIAQKEMQAKMNNKWKNLYSKIYKIVYEGMVKNNLFSQKGPTQRENINNQSNEQDISIPQYNASLIELIMPKIEDFIEKWNKKFSNFGIILNDIGQRCLYYFSLLIIWRLLCYGQWRIKSLHLKNLYNETDAQFNKFRADRLENQYEQSSFRGNSLAVEIFSNFQQRFLSENSIKCQNQLRNLYQQTNSSLIKQLDYEILERGDQNISDEQIMAYISNQQGYIEKVVHEDLIKQIEKIQGQYQQSLQQETKKFLLKVQQNSKNLIDLSIDQMKAKDYFCDQNVQHEKILFRIVIQCLQGSTQVKELQMVKEENRDVFTLLNPIQIENPLIGQERNRSDCQVQILKFFMMAFTGQIQEYISNCHNLQLDLTQLNIQSVLDNIKLMYIGCQKSCPICKRKCDQDQKDKNHKHACANGHQLRGMAGVLIQNNPSLYMCEEINDQCQLKIQETGVIKSWKEIKSIYNDWQFSCLSTDELRQRKNKMMNIWNNKIGNMICKQLERDLGISINYVPKYDNQQVKPQKIHQVLILDSSGSMSGGKWENVVNGVRQFMNEIENNNQAKVTIIIFDNVAECVVNCEYFNISQRMKLIFKGGGTNFDEAFLLAYEKIVNNPEFNQFDIHQMLFYTDGQAQLPYKAIQKFKEISENKKQKIQLIACTEERLSNVLEELINQLKAFLPLAELRKSVAPPQMSQAWIETISLKYHQLQI